MVSKYFAFLGFALAAISLVWAFIGQRKVASLQALLNEAANRFQLGKEAYQKLQAEHQKGAEEESIRRQTVNNLEKNLEEARKKFQSQKIENEATILSLREEMRRVELKKEHLEEENRELMTQIREAEQLKNASMKELRGAAIESDMKLKAETAHLRQQLDEWRQKAHTLESENRKMKVVFAKVDPAESNRNRVKAREMERLFQSMKGLRELAEERNNNLEVAVRKLSAYITRKPETLADGTPSPLGPMVGEALESIGARLVDDEFLASSAPELPSATP